MQKPDSEVFANTLGLVKNSRFKDTFQPFTEIPANPPDIALMSDQDELVRRLELPNRLKEGLARHKFGAWVTVFALRSISSNVALHRSQGSYQSSF
jgi:hypothetical protein